MDHREENPASWGDLARRLGGSFVARVRGVVSPEIVLLTPDGETLGRLTVGESGGAQLQAGNLTARIEPLPGANHRMSTGNAETLAAESAGSPTTLNLRSGGRLYEARISLLRNRATARSEDGKETVRLSGGLTNRRYRAAFDPQDPASLPIAIYLLHHTVKLRRSAYRARS